MDEHSNKKEVKEFMSWIAFGLPVYNRNYDDIVGVVNLKNIFAHIDDDDFNLSDLMTEALYDGTDDGIQSLGAV
jgi:putative hemolysin